MIYKLTLDPHALETENECSDQHWQQLVRAGGIPKLIKQCHSSSSNAVKLNVINTLKNIITCKGVPATIVSADGIGLMLELLKSGTKPIVNAAAACLQEIASISQEYANEVSGYVYFLRHILVYYAISTAMDTLSQNFP